jgi:DDE superfamily endonuclease.
MPSTPSRHRVTQECASDIFFPPDCSSKLQPLDPGMIHSLKAKYRAVLVQKAIASLQNKTEPKLNILQVMHTEDAMWNSMGSAAVRNCFRKAGSLVIKTLRKIMRRLQ